MSEVQSNPQNVEQVKIDEIYSIDGQSLKRSFYAALVWLRNHQQVINSLNVFPVPDGDTGTNMFLTMQSAYSEIAESKETNVGKIAHMISQGALMGARGNSGVILSQLLRGFARSMDEKPAMDADLLVQSLAESRNTAYKGVVRPVEGTILTVAKDMAKAAEEARQESSELIAIIDKTLKAGEESLKNTPNLLPILKQAGVVDSGGKGLVVILEGIYRYATHQPIEIGEVSVERSPINLDAMQLSQMHEEIEPGQDFEIVVDFRPEGQLNLDSFYDDLSKIGTSIQVGEGDDMYRMHIHVATEKKYDPIELVGKYGAVQKVYIENLLEQMNADRKDSDFSNPVEEGQIAIVAVSPGNGISVIFKSLGVSRIVSGGQTMNPSTNDILQAYKDLPTDKIIILPNNKNIIMAAEASKKLSDKQVEIIPTKNIPQGLSACLRLNPQGDFKEIVAEMMDSLDEVEAGEITTATRSIELNGVKVKEGEVIALLNGDLVSSSKSIVTACSELLEKAHIEDREHITIFYGSDTTMDQVKEVSDFIAKTYPNHEIEIHEGGQPHYQFILSIE